VVLKVTVKMYVAKRGAGCQVCVARVTFIFFVGHLQTSSQQQVNLFLCKILHDRFSSAMASGQRWAKSGSLRQTYFGFSAQNTLTILDRHKVFRTEAFIFRLPDELLVTVFELATSNLGSGECYYNCETPSNNAAIKTLALTCHRFNHVVLPLLYRTIRFNYPHRTVPPAKPVKSLHSNLQKNPSLWQYCRVLWIGIDNKSGIEMEDFSIANDFVSWLTKVRCLKIQGGFEGKHNEHTWTFIRNGVRHMRELEHLSISRGGWGLYLRPIMEWIDIPSLRKLEVYGVSETEDGAVVLEPKVLQSSHE
jgi:F-box-like